MPSGGHCTADRRQSPNGPPPLAVCPALRRRVPHLPAFFPERSLLPAESSPAGATALLLEGAGPTRPPGGGALHATESPWRAPRFGDRHAPVALLGVEGGAAPAPPLALALQGAPPPDAAARAAARIAMALLREARIGGAPGLPDPGPAGLGLPRGEAVLVLDPCRPQAAAAARAMLRAALAGAGGRPVLVADSPSAPAGARGVLEGAARLRGRLAPWTLLDLAREVHGLGEETELLALAAGLPVRSPAPWAGREPEAVFAALLAATRWADPFRARPWTAEEGLRQLAQWRAAEAEHRRIVACTGIEWFKRRRIRAALASGAGGPRIVARGGRAIRLAREAGGAVGVWASVMPPDLPARCAAAGVELVQLEDGFIRSAGLGVLLAPAASLVCDPRGIHYDSETESGLERLLAATEFDAALLARAARLREALIARGITKYNLSGAAPALDLPPERRAILVPGQVEDDAAIRRGGARIRTNLDLLRAVRRENPEALLLYKPHPDVEAGMRAGAVPPREAAALADRVLSGVPIASVYGLVQEVHVISSLAGFEALLRGLRVVTWGRPFYAGWGLTEDRDPPPRRSRRLSLDALVAGALILYPRYQDPITGLPCPPEVLVDRLAEGMRRAPPRAAVPVPLRALVARASRFLAEWWAGR
jgi:capsular polysaccharide export protein